MGVVRLIWVRRFGFGFVVTLASFVLTIGVFSPSATARKLPQQASVKQVAIVSHEAPATPAIVPALDIDVPALVHHVESTTRLIGHPVRDLTSQLGAAASVTDDAIEWNVSDLGIAAGSTYAYASVVAGKVTGVVFRGRATLERLQEIKVRR
ncbi:MAG TPA: hypothetical protein VGO00_04160, partial [Kofleriaceae bacterium]|nr:hypothetical protein [Kofleriaceae bacterium]